jgi:hypothetical protein
MAFLLVELAFLEQGFPVVHEQETSLFRWAMCNRPTESTAGPVTLRQSNSLAALETTGQ